MTLFSKLLAFSAFLMLIAAILYVLLGQITVRKLRKNPEVQNELGIELESGWDILNVAGALSTPRWLREKFLSSPLSRLSANYQLLYDNTTKFDRVLARVFWFFYVVSVGLMLLFIAANSSGILG